MGKRSARCRNHDRESVFRKKQQVRTALLFCLLATVLNVVFYLLVQEDYLNFYNILNTKVAASLMHLTGIEAIVERNVIRLSNAVWIVDTECTAINLLLIFVSFVVVYPASLQAKAIGLLIGVPFIFLANIIRLWAMAWVDKLVPAYTSYFHDYVWQVAFLIMVGFMWLVWIEKAVNRAVQENLSH